MPTPCVVWTTKSPGLRSARSAAKTLSWLLVMPGRAIRSDGSKRSSEPMKAMSRIGEDGAAADQSLDQIRVGDGAGQIGALGEIGRGGFVGGESELEGHGVFAQNVGEAFELADCDGAKRATR